MRLLKQRLLQHFRQRIAARIGPVRRRLRHRAPMVVEEMADAGVAADQDELLGRRARTERLGQPEQALDRHVHDEFGELLAGREMHDMGDAVHGALDGAAVGDRAFHHLEPRRWRKRAIVAQSADDEVGMRLRAQPPDEVRSDLSGRARNQEPHLILTGPICFRRRRPARPRLQALFSDSFPVKPRLEARPRG